MALVKCSSCEKEVSPKATACPHCGQPDPAKKKTNKKNIVIGAAIVIFALIVIGNLGEKSDKSANTGPAAKPAATAPPTREEVLKKQFSPWDGSHRGLERLIKKA